MRLRTVMTAAAMLSLSACAENGQDFGSQVMRGVQSTLAGENHVIGTAEVISPMRGYITCFKDTPGSAIARTPITHLSQAAGFPSMVMTTSGVVSSGACAELRKAGLLTLTAEGMKL